MSDEEIRREQAARLKKAREAAGFEKAVDAAQAMRHRGLGVVQSTYLGHENGSRGMQRSAMVTYAKFFKIRPAWLITGEGEPGSSSIADTPDIPPHIAGSSSGSLPEYDIRAGASYAGGQEPTIYKDGDVSGHEPVAQWGLPSVYVESELGLRFGFADVLAVEGDSMDDGSRYALISGDRIVVDRRSTNVRQGGIFVIWDGDGHIIKQVELVRGSDPPVITCKSLNKRYADFNIILDGNARVIGRVAAKITRM